MPRFLHLLLPVLLAGSLRAEYLFTVGPGHLPSVNAALQARRAALAKGEQDACRIQIAGGIYPMTEPLILLPSDSGTPEHPLVIEAVPGSTPILSGGVVLQHLRDEPGGLRIYRRPENLVPEALWLGSYRAIHARHPNRGFYLLWGCEAVPADGDTFRYFMSVAPIAFASLEGLSPLDPASLRMVGLHSWDFTRRAFEKLDIYNGQMTALGPRPHPWNPLSMGSRVWFEGHPALLDEPGEWAVSGDEILIQWPVGLDRSAPVTAALLPTLIQFQGQPDQPVHDIQVRGLCFQHTAASPPPHDPHQASIRAPAALQGEYLHRVTVENCQILHAGAHGIRFGSDTRQCQIRDSLFEDLGGGGIYLAAIPHGHPYSPAVSNRVENCVIAHGGRHYFSSVGIFLGHASDNLVDHNHVSDFFYTGLSVGWVWGYAESPSKRNRITHNRVQHLGQGLLDDMGGIYTLGRSEGTVVRGNIFHDIHCYAYGGWGMYTDEGSTGILFENNLAVNTSTGALHQHYGRENTFRNNILANATHWQMQLTRSEDHLSFTFQNNIVLWARGRLFQGPWNAAQTQTSSNLYWCADGTDIRFQQHSLQEWQALGHEIGSLIADPRLEVDATGRLDLPPDSPAHTIGFKPHDWSRAGTRPGPHPLWGTPNIPARPHPQATQFRFLD